MFIHSQFSQDNLLVNIIIKKSSDDSIVVNNESMTSLGYGLYKFNFNSRVPTEQYYYFCTDTANNITNSGVIEADQHISTTIGLTEEEHNKLMSLENTSLGTLEKKVKLLATLLPTLQGSRR